jgi:hypothetical protein
VHASTVPVKQPHIEQVLQGIQASRQRGLGDVQEVGGFMHIPVLHNCSQVTELFYGSHSQPIDNLLLSINDN